jgi:hypothetical protein
MFIKFRSEIEKGSPDKKIFTAMHVSVLLALLPTYKSLIGAKTEVQTKNKT